MSVRTTAFALLAGMTLVGCASPTKIDPALAGLSNAKIVGTPPRLEAIEFDYTLAGVGKPLPLCIAQNVRNRATTQTATPINNMAKTLVGNRAQSVSGGGVISYVSDDEKTVVANGNTTYNFTFALAPVDRTVRFSLNAETAEQRLNLLFDDIQQLQNNATQLHGFQRLPAWEDAGGIEAYQALEKLARSVANCVGGGTSTLNSR